MCTLNEFSVDLSVSKQCDDQVRQVRTLYKCIIGKLGRENPAKLAKKDVGLNFTKS